VECGRGRVLFGRDETNSGLEFGEEGRRKKTSNPVSKMLTNFDLIFISTLYSSQPYIHFEF
jgi:hypothetical protein